MGSYFTYFCHQIFGSWLLACVFREIHWDGYDMVPALISVAINQMFEIFQYFQKIIEVCNLYGIIN